MVDGVAMIGEATEVTVDSVVMEATAAVMEVVVASEVVVVEEATEAAAVVAETGVEEVAVVTTEEEAEEEDTVEVVVVDGNGSRSYLVLYPFFACVRSKMHCLLRLSLFYLYSLISRILKIKQKRHNSTLSKYLHSK
jgi:hypothetical protein